MTYFTPDRSNRPTGADDPTRGTTELNTDRTRTIELADGRTAVVEAAGVDGFTLVYYYFDATDLEHAAVGDLEAFLAESGIHWPSSRDDIDVYTSCSRTEDARGRDIWVFQITYA